MPADSTGDPSGGAPEPLASDPESAATASGKPLLVHRVVAALEVLICSDYPTQTALGATFIALGYGPKAASGQLEVGFVVALLLLDTALLLGLMLFFLYAHGER